MTCLPQKQTLQNNNDVPLLNLTKLRLSETLVVAPKCETTKNQQCLKTKVKAQFSQFKRVNDTPSAAAAVTTKENKSPNTVTPAANATWPTLPTFPSSTQETKTLHTLQSKVQSLIQQIRQTSDYVVSKLPEKHNLFQSGTATAQVKAFGDVIAEMKQAQSDQSDQVKSIIQQVRTNFETQFKQGQAGFPAEIVLNSKETVQLTEIVQELNQLIFKVKETMLSQQRDQRLLNQSQMLGNSAFIHSTTDDAPQRVEPTPRFQDKNNQLDLSQMSQMLPLNLTSSCMPDQTLQVIKSELEHQLVELRLENHLKDERIVKFQDLTQNLSLSFDHTLKDHLRRILSESQYLKIQKLLVECEPLPIDEYDMQPTSQSPLQLYDNQQTIPLQITPLTQNEYQTIHPSDLDQSNFMAGQTLSASQLHLDASVSNFQSLRSPQNHQMPLQMHNSRSQRPRSLFRNLNNNNAKTDQQSSSLQQQQLKMELNDLKQSIVYQQNQQHQQQQPPLNLQSLIDGHSSTIEALNQRELLLQEREMSLIQNQKDLTQNQQRFKSKLSKIQNDDQKLRIRKTNLEAEWSRVDQMREEAQNKLKEADQRLQELMQKEDEIEQSHLECEEIKANLAGYEENLEQREYRLNEWEARLQEESTAMEEFSSQIKKAEKRMRVEHSSILKHQSFTKIQEQEDEGQAEVQPRRAQQKSLSSIYIPQDMKNILQPSHNNHASKKQVPSLQKSQSNYFQSSYMKSSVRHVKPLTIKSSLSSINLRQSNLPSQQINSPQTYNEQDLSQEQASSNLYQSRQYNESKFTPTIEKVGTARFPEDSDSDDSMEDRIRSADSQYLIDQSHFSSSQL